MVEHNQMNQIIAEPCRGISAIFPEDRLEPILFGSYARGDETPESDIDVVVFGGDHFKKTDIFAFAEDLREALATNADVFEISEVDKGTPLYDSLMKEGIKILR